MKKMIAVALLAVGLDAGAAPINLQQNFDDLLASGWVIVNVSSPLGPTSWFQGNPGVFSAQAGAANSYAAANFFSTDPLGGTISTWLISPEIQFSFQTLSFFTRTETGSPFDDGLSVQVSLNGASISLGDFSEIANVNGSNTPGGYPDDWTMFSLLLGGAGTGRIAFEYTVNANAIANYIGIDTVSIHVPEPGSLSLLVMALAVLGLARRRSRSH